MNRLALQHKNLAGIGELGALGIGKACIQIFERLHR